MCLDVLSASLDLLLRGDAVGELETFIDVDTNFSGVLVASVFGEDRFQAVQLVLNLRLTILEDSSRAEQSNA